MHAQPTAHSVSLVIAAINEILAENGHPAVELTAGNHILRDTPLDSMGLALAVLRLEDKTGKDPFADGFIRFRTVGELAALYDR